MGDIIIRVHIINSLRFLLIFVFIYFNNEDDSIILDNTLSEVSDDVNTTTLITDSKVFIDIKNEYLVLCFICRFNI